MREVAKGALQGIGVMACVNNVVCLMPMLCYAFIAFKCYTVLSPTTATFFSTHQFVT